MADYEDLMSMATQSLVPPEQDEVNGQADYSTCDLFDELLCQKLFFLVTMVVISKNEKEDLLLLSLIRK